MVAAPTHLISHGLYAIVALPFPPLTLRERAASSPCLAVLPLVPPHGLVGQNHQPPSRGVMPETVPHRGDKVMALQWPARVTLAPRAWCTTNEDRGCVDAGCCG